MERIEQEKQEIYKDIKTNVDKILTPILNALILQLPESRKNYVEMLRTNLDEITSPFISRLSVKNYSMTPTELSICNMIRNGMRTKEIAEMRNVSEATINRHREKIRYKLNLTNKNINLASFLQSTLWEENVTV